MLSKPVTGSTGALSFFLIPEPFPDDAATASLLFFPAELCPLLPSYPKLFDHANALKQRQQLP
jgi:hypothetical protein